jgi:hypothetical protein
MQVYRSTAYTTRNATQSTHTRENICKPSSLMGILLCGTGTTIRHNIQKHTYHTKYHTTLEQNTAHKATQTLNGTLHIANEKLNYNFILPKAPFGLEPSVFSFAAENLKN